MKIQWLAHATFLIEGNGLRIVTDPYTPDVLGFPEVQEKADLVIRSSADDEGHCNAAMILGEPVVVTATEIPPGGVEVKGIHVVAIPAQESLIYKQNPGINAMYRFALESMQIAHLGDVGNQLSADQVAALQNTDVLMVPAGGPPTINLEDLWEAIALIRPRIVIPMHYHLPMTKVKMLPVTEFTAHFPPAIVDWQPHPEVELSRSSLPRELRIWVLKPAVFSKPR
jgi:L-ascorbate metabolism protein UlaG (beta-lactamase superfamily)